MKINVAIECEPEEIRRLAGLPDVTAINDALVTQIQKRVENGFDSEDMDKLVKLWFTSASASMGEMQKSFWSLLQSASNSMSGGHNSAKDE